MKRSFGEMDQRREEFGKLRGIETGINTADGVMSESVPKSELERVKMNEVTM